MKNGTTLVEFLIGLILFSIFLGFAALGIRYSHQAISTTGRNRTSQVILQNGLDDAARTIRNCVAVQGGGPSLQCLDSKGNWNVLSVANQTLLLNQTPLQSGIDAMNFSILPGAVSNYVAIAAAVKTNDETGLTTRTLSTSVALRNNPQPSPSPSPQPLPVVPPPPTPAPAPSPLSPPPVAAPSSPTRPWYDCPPGYWGGGAVPCRPIPPIQSGGNGRNFMR